MSQSRAENSAEYFCTKTDGNGQDLTVWPSPPQLLCFEEKALTSQTVPAAAGAGLGGYRMSRRVGDVSEFQFEPIGENHQQVRP